MSYVERNLLSLRTGNSQTIADDSFVILRDSAFYFVGTPAFLRKRNKEIRMH